MKKKQILILLADIVFFAAIRLLPTAAGVMLASGSECLFYRLGFLCPSCGGTRCVQAFFTGKFLEALTLNPFVVFLILYGTVWLILMNLDCLAGRKTAGKLAMGMISPKAVILLASAFGLFGLLRNVV